MGKYFKKDEGDFYYRRKVWAEKAKRGAEKHGLKATIHIIPGGGRRKGAVIYEVRVRQK